MLKLTVSQFAELYPAVPGKKADRGGAEIHIGVNDTDGKILQVNGICAGPEKNIQMRVFAAGRGINKGAGTGDPAQADIVYLPDVSRMKRSHAFPGFEPLMSSPLRLGHLPSLVGHKQWDINLSTSSETLNNGTRILYSDSYSPGK
jgi:hypothetical protein